MSEGCTVWKCAIFRIAPWGFLLNACYPPDTAFSPSILDTDDSQMNGKLHGIFAIQERCVNRIEHFVPVFSYLWCSLFNDALISAFNHAEFKRPLNNLPCFLSRENILSNQIGKAFFLYARCMLISEDQLYLIELRLLWLLNTGIKPITFRCKCHLI